MSAFAVLSLAAISAAQSTTARLWANDRNVVIPETSIPAPGDAGYLMHTNHLIYIGPWTNENNIYAMMNPEFGPAAASSPSGYSPANIRSAYGVPSSGGSGTICIVDAYNDPNALNDFNVFAAQYGLPQETSSSVTSSSNQHFQVLYASGSKPTNNGGWAQEESLDFEWAHALAPSAKIVLVEASSASTSALLQAESVAASQPGCLEVSNSWGGGEFSGESSYDSYFSHSGVVFFASSGDSGGVREWPAASANVVACGGTSLHLSGGAYSSESAWSGTGCGPSAYVARPSWQSGISTIVGSARGIADISADADPNTGVSVYDSYSYQGYSGWLVFGGTSVACPCLAAMANNHGLKESSSTAEHNLIYGGLGGSNYHDVTSGSAGSYSARSGWDFPTGVGSPKGIGGI